MAKGLITSAIPNQNKIWCQQKRNFWKWCYHKCTFACCPYDVPVHLSCGVSTLSKRSKTQCTCSKLHDHNLRCLWLLWMNLLIVLPRVRHLCNLVAVKQNIILSADLKIERITVSAAIHCIKASTMNTIVTSSTQANYYSGSYAVFCNSWVVFLEISPDSQLNNNLPDDRISGVR